MQKTKLKLLEFYNLEAELNGAVNPENGEVVIKGLLSEKIKLTTKYWLNDLLTKVKAEKAACEEIKNELIKKYGEVDEQGNTMIQAFINVVKDDQGKVVSAENNPKFIEFQNEWNPLLNEEKEIEHKAFSLSDFEDVESEVNYQTIFKLIKVEE